MRNKRIIYILYAFGSFIVVYFFNLIKSRAFQGNGSDFEYYLESIQDIFNILGGPLSYIIHSILQSISNSTILWSILLTSILILYIATISKAFFKNNYKDNKIKYILIVIFMLLGMFAWYMAGMIAGILKMLSTLTV
jgi:hypothetical protein